MLHLDPDDQPQYIVAADWPADGCPEFKFRGYQVDDPVEAALTAVSKQMQALSRDELAALQAEIICIKY